MRIEVDYPIDGDDPRPQEKIESEVKDLVELALRKCISPSEYAKFFEIEVVVIGRHLMAKPEIRLVNGYILFSRGEPDDLMNSVDGVVGLALIQYNIHLKVRLVIAKHLRNQWSFG